MKKSAILSLLLRLPLIQAAAITAASSHLLFEEIYLPGVLLSISIVTFAYTRDRLEDHQEDNVNSTGATDIIRKKETTFELVSLISILAYASLILKVSIDLVSSENTIQALLLLLVSTIPLVSLSLHERLKSYVVIDSLNIGLGWVAGFVVLQYIMMGASNSGGLFIVCAFWIPVVMAGAELININDIAGDKAAGKPTLPTTVGPLATERIVFSTFLCCYGVLYVNYGVTLGTVLATIYPVLVYIFNWNNLPLQRTDRVPNSQ